MVMEILKVLIYTSGSIVGAALLSACGVLSGSEQSAFDQAVERYLLAHPDVIERALQDLAGQRQEAEKIRVAQAIAMRQADLLRDPASPVSGNANGDVTIVEFFDYRCRYCKQVARALVQLQQEDPDVRVVYKDFPVLGEASVFAAYAALAAERQGKHQAFHEALLASENALTRDDVMAIAKRIGLNLTELEVDIKEGDWQAILDRNRSLAGALGISGTPGFVIGREVYPGALDLDGFKARVARARARF